MNRNNYSPRKTARLAAAALMHACPDPLELPPAGRWHYHQGVFLLGLQRLAELDDDLRLLDYTHRYLDGLIAPDGNVPLVQTELDAMQPGNLLYRFLDESPDNKRFRTAIDTIVALLDNFPRTDQGGFWHKHKYPNQQWLDGLYMAGPVSVHYGRKFDRPDYFRLFATQARLIEAGANDPASGLLRHGFDRSREAPWADTTDGKAPEVWGRALGWFPAALLDMLDYIPPGSEEADELREIFQRVMPPIINNRDSASRLWFQVIDRPDDPANWIESSCSALFIYSIAKGVRTGLLDPTLLTTAKESFAALLKQCCSLNADGLFELNNICIGTGIGTCDFYLQRPVRTNDLHGVGAFILAAVELARATEGQVI
ncbi:glycoside hydrolase family 88 protein [Marispirochaeta sp.]|uniref:glycoside hydrolase family 88/105 protein n=1 Tax=Marispirochaeta sp. TaxID=2038653 RepID=UPI0029C778FB|nr:glycoside hydrolase family 88 protein [Marispirochaeta sp.]